MKPTPGKSLKEIAEELRFEAFHTSDHATRATMLKAFEILMSHEEKYQDECLKSREFHNRRECRIVDTLKPFIAPDLWEAAGRKMMALDREMPWDWV
ncbi:MAG: hypothetical protein LBM04_10745 [Opitutaceae bacterium]|nr:hypothetical protein [Opitutaceae bacterium]